MVSRIAGVLDGRFGLLMSCIPASVSVLLPFLRLHVIQQVTMFSQFFRPT